VNYWIRQLRTSDFGKIYTARDQLAEMGPKAIPALKRELANEDSTRRLAAVFALEYFGANAAPALPMLVECLSDTDWKVREAALRALISLEDDSVPQLVRALDSSSSLQIAQCARCLGAIGPSASSADRRQLFFPFSDN
jgi:HEAT repeat protein